MLNFRSFGLGFCRRCALLAAVAIGVVALSDLNALGQGLQQGEERQGKPIWSLEVPVDIWIWTGDSSAVLGHLASHLSEGGRAASRQLEADDLVRLEALCQKLADSEIGHWTSLGLAFTEEGQCHAVLLGTTDLTQRQLEDAIDVEGLNSRLGPESEVLVHVYDGQYVISNSADHFEAAFRQLKTRDSDEEISRAVRQTFAMLGSRGRPSRDERESTVVFYVDTNRVPRAANRLFQMLQAGVGPSTSMTMWWDDLPTIESTGIGGRFVIRNSEVESVREVSVDIHVGLASPRSGFLANLRPVDLADFPFTGDAITRLFRIGLADFSEQQQPTEEGRIQLPFGLTEAVPESMVQYVVEAIYFVTTRKDRHVAPISYGDFAYRLDNKAGTDPESIRECVGGKVLLYTLVPDVESLRSVKDGDWLIWQVDESAVDVFIERENALIDQIFEGNLRISDANSINSTGQLASDDVRAQHEKWAESARAGQQARVAVLRESRWLSYRGWIFRAPIASSSLPDLRSEPTPDQLLYRGSAMKAARPLVEQFQAEKIVAISGSVTRIVQRDLNEPDPDAVDKRPATDESPKATPERVTEVLFGAVVVDQASGVLISGNLSLEPIELVPQR